MELFEGQHARAKKLLGQDHRNKMTFRHRRIK